MRELVDIVGDLYSGRNKAITSAECKRLYEHLSKTHSVIGTALELGWNETMQEISAKLRKEFQGSRDVECAQCSKEFSLLPYQVKDENVCAECTLGAERIEQARQDQPSGGGTGKVN